jgi:hypothetical protein
MYKMTQRPFGIGCQPKGHVSLINSDWHTTGYHSIVGYDLPLTVTEINDFELTPVEVNHYEVEDRYSFQGVEVFTTYDDAYRFAQKRSGETGRRQFIKQVTRKSLDVVIPLNELPF